MHVVPMDYNSFVDYTEAALDSFYMKLCHFYHPRYIHFYTFSFTLPKQFFLIELVLISMNVGIAFYTILAIGNTDVLSIMSLRIHRNYSEKVLF